MAIVLLHALHAGIVIVGGLVVLALVRPGADHRRVAQLRRAAARGELVDLARARARAEFMPTGVPAAPRPTALRPTPALWLAATATLVAAAVHAAVGPEHFREGLRFGLFFVALSTAQIVLAAVLVRRPSLPAARFAIVLSVATVVLWAVTRTVGLPYGLAEAEPVGFADLSASVAETVAAAAAGWWVVRNAVGAHRPRSRVHGGVLIDAG